MRRILLVFKFNARGNDDDHLAVRLLIAHVKKRTLIKVRFAGFDHEFCMIQISELEIRERPSLGHANIAVIKP